MVTWARGYSQQALDDAQLRFGLRFPPDLVALYRERRPVQGYDWSGDPAPIRRALEWPAEGLIFDVEENALWLAEWGDRPGHASDRAAIVHAAVANAPRLIPILGHRYIPETPHEAGNPVFSVYQSDIIVYGSNLANYLAHEFSAQPFGMDDEPRYIPFWSDLAG